MLQFLINTWNSGISNKITMIAGALILLGGCGGVIYGVARKGGYKDQTLMRSPAGTDVRWAPGTVFPLTVWISETLNPAYIQVAEAVNAELTAAIGRVPFRFEPAGPVKLEATELLQGHIAIADDEGAMPTEGVTDYVLNRDGTLKAARVTVPEIHGANWDVAYKLVIHELGHVLGLGHDDDPTSVMHPWITNAIRQTLTDADKKLLRKLYG